MISLSSLLKQLLAVAFEIRKFSCIWLEILPSTGLSRTYYLRSPGPRAYHICGIQGKVYDWTVLIVQLKWVRNSMPPYRRMLVGVTWFYHWLASPSIIFLAHLWVMEINKIFFSFLSFLLDLLFLLWNPW